MKIALVHDWLNQMGGAENVLEELVDLFPDAPLFTSMYGPEKMPEAYRQWPIQTSFMQKLPGVTDHHQAFLPLYPLAFQNTDLSGYDLVVSNKSGFCHGVKTARADQRAMHVCYCLTPTRFLWLYEQYREREQIGGGLNAVLQPVLALLRRWDYAAAQRVDHFIAISSAVQERIQRIYHRESVIIHPPVDTERFTPAPDQTKPGQAVGDYYLIVSRLIPYKRIDLAVEAFRHLPQEKLIVVGDGRDKEALQAQAADNVQFLGRQSWDELVRLMRGCKAFLFPGLEDFGIAPVEAMSAGRPVIAFGGGGALDTVIPGVTGEHFSALSAESLLSVLTDFDPLSYDPKACRAQAETFSRQQFRQKLTGYLHELMGQPQPDVPLPVA